MKLRLFYLRCFGVIAFIALVMMTHTACTLEKDIDTLRKQAWASIINTVKYDLNGGIGAVPAPEKGSYRSSITLPDGSRFSRDGYDFEGWNTKADGTGKKYNGGASYTITGNVTLYAMWDAIDITINSITIATDDGEIKDGVIEGVIGGEIWFYAELEMEPEDAGDYAYAVTWKVSGGNGDSYIDEDGFLSIDSQETASPAAFNADTWLTVTAASVIDPQKSATVRVKMVVDEPPPPPPTLTVYVTPEDAATITIRRGASVIQSGSQIAPGTNITIQYTQTTAQKNDYEFEFFAITPTTTYTGDGKTAATRWAFVMPDEDTEITIEFRAIEPDPDPTLTVAVVPVGTASVRVYRGTTSVSSGSQVAAGTVLSMYYSQTTAQRNEYELDFIEAVPDIDFDPDLGNSSSNRWFFEMPDEDTEITIGFKSKPGEDPTLSWTVTGGSLLVTAGGTATTTGATHPAGTAISIVATPTTAGATPTITGGVTATGSGTAADPWRFTMPASDMSFTVTFTPPPVQTNELLIYDDGTKPAYSTIIVHHDDNTLNNFTLTPNQEGFGSDNVNRTGLEVNITTISNWLGLEIRAANDVDIGEYNALSFKIRGNNLFNIGWVAFGGDGIDGGDAQVTYRGEANMGIYVTQTWQTVVVPVPSAKTTNTKTVFFLVAYSTEINGKRIWLDEIKFIKNPNIKLNTISLPAQGGNVTHKAAPNNTIPLATFGRKLTATYLCPPTGTGTATLYGNNVNFPYWFSDINYTVTGAAASKSGNNLVTSGVGTFTLGMSFGTKTSNNMTLNVRQATLPLDNGYPADVVWGQIGSNPLLTFPATRPVPTPGMIDDFTYAYATKAEWHNWSLQLIGAPYWYGSDPPMIDGQCFPRNSTYSIQMLGEDLGGWASIGRTGFLLNLSTYTTIRFGAAEANGCQFTFALQSGDVDMGTDKSFSYQFTPTAAGSTITIPLSTFSSNGVDLTEITSYSFNYLPGSGNGTIQLWIYDGIQCE